MFQPRVETKHAVADAFIEWINSFDHISHPCKSIGDLYDGIVLFEVLADIDPKWFKLIRSADVGDNWVLRVNNLKKLHRLVSLFYKEKLNRDPSTLPSVNLNLIAKEADIDETISLCQLVLGIAMQCDLPQRQTYIEKIQSLSQPCMQVLMQKIEEVSHLFLFLLFIFLVCIFLTRMKK
ncbi:hypothetical protein BCR43DRAFT_434696 [Syncephalastrum racemosum]|uniref:HOOK N-terminal domain-containing protein n=1 Tax=Syncephalastrum racemosum TaxID=13706 RepID=A0A1X2HL24_SYNRA|nr:hypothetical protein BCR43DRAFT_434696 [Syncephalastrum racemosum]